MVSSQSKMMTASFCERETRQLLATVWRISCLLHMTRFDCIARTVHDEKILSPTMQKIRPFRACMDLPFDPLLGGGDMVASVFAACNGLSLLLTEQFCGWKKNEKPRAKF